MRRTLYQVKNRENTLYFSFMISAAQQKKTSVDIFNYEYKKGLLKLNREAVRLGWNIDHLICFYHEKLDGRNIGVLKGYKKYTFGFTHVNNTEGRILYAPME